ncbi:protein phosphatase 1 regulatory subunit 14B-like isoform X1 [Myxocyprinus asiaticus]|uniref:protein phosphatase 1 regulatory subunit 14B-like isoform X1 n=1 Tax=Myxocyprinus asiaticus TaxID=70543 RepID=UPI002221B1AB|nr:protein phosphatase 1 regulatory subunit 14B-like isoform X1 [Myxocyprinus asiaticus]
MASEPGTQSRVMFQTKEEEPAQRKLGKLTVKYNRKDLQRRLDIEEWIDGQLHLLYDCEEEEIPELEIDIDELLELTDTEQRSRLQELLQECGKPKEPTCYLSPITGLYQWAALSDERTSQDVRNTEEIG